MKSVLVSSTLFACLVAGPGARQKAVCDLFTDSEIASLLGVAEVRKQAILGENTCSWTARGVMLMVAREETEPEIVTGLLDASLENSRPGEKAQEEPGLGQRAVSTVGPYGRSLNLIVGNGGVFWRFAFDKVDQKIDVADALPKLKGLARKAL
jgi:hypothetical protein